MQKFKGQQHRWGISGWVGVENPQNKQKHEYFTCIGQILHTSSTPEDCSHMTPLYSEPPQHWCSHSRKCCAGFLSSRPGFLVWPPRFAPSLCWRGEFFSLSGISLQLKLQVVKTFYFAQSFSFYRPAPQILGGGEAGDGLYHYGKWWTPTSNSPIEILNILSLESYRNTGLYFHHTYFIEVNFMFLYVLTKISVNLTL